MTTSTETKALSFPKTGDWPKHASGNPKRVCDMTREERAVFVNAARIRFEMAMSAQPAPRPRKITGRAALRVDDVTRPE